jgi:hypothetical protein
LAQSHDTKKTENACITLFKKETENYFFFCFLNTHPVVDCVVFGAVVNVWNLGDVKNSLFGVVQVLFRMHAGITICVDV